VNAVAPARRVIAIGGSAGGLGALTRILADLPADLPAAVLAVLHMPATSKSRLPVILQRRGRLPAVVPTVPEVLEEGTIYVALPDRHLMVGRGEVYLGHGPRENGHRPAIDTLFRTAARHYGPAAVGVVLCGTLDDGSAGLRAIRRRGTAVVVDPADCDFHDMPESAIAAAEPQHVVSLSEMGPLLTELVQRPVPVPSWLGMAPAAPPDESAGKEAAIMGRSEELWGDDRPGRPSGYTCPDCHGVLWEIEEGPVPHFECRIGHRVSPETLLEQRVDEVEGAIWAAVRALEEQASLATRLWQRASDRGDMLTAERFQRRAEAARQQATVLRDVALRPRIEPDSDALEARQLGSGG
jgi:two-component system chemotaxis response regulator CheB